MKHNLHVKPERFAQLAERVFGIAATGKSAEEVGLAGIEKLRGFWSSLGAPARLADYEIDDSQLDVMADKAMINGEFGKFKRLNKEDVLSIYRASL
jgi:alcohol dehydrogenase YqhD (iron-dependent ADH family)